MANLVTIQQYKDFAGLQGVQSDARINTLIPQVTQIVKTYCGSSILDYYSSAKTEYFDIRDGLTDRVMLDESPINSVTSVSERDSQSDSYTTLITENSDSSGKYEYIIDTMTDSIIRTTSTGTKYFPRGHKAVKVIYTAGYSATPDDLKLAVYDLIKYYLKDERKARMQIAGAMVENQSTSGIAGNIGFPDHIKRILDFYKIYK
tara:strand:+ start:117 stop:728 length:612 start_codon:yes stop_codon:yes gene_type:complete